MRHATNRLEVIVFEPDPLIGADLTEAAKSQHYKVCWATDLAAVTDAFAMCAPRPTLLTSARCVQQHGAALARLLRQHGAAAILSGASAGAPAQMPGAALLPEPFAHGDVVDALANVAR